jgi:hypothetical protein
MSEHNTNNKNRIDEYISNHDCEIHDRVPVNIRGEKINLVVYKLPIEILYYNIRNGRFAAEYRNEVKKEGGILSPEKKEDAKKIQNLLWRLNVNDSEDTYEDILQRGQWRPGIITEDGYVIDGNRRMAILSKLFTDTGNDEFKFIKVGRLPSNIEKTDLWKLEAGLQLGREEIVKYGPMNELLKLEEAKMLEISNEEIVHVLYGFDDVKIIEAKLDILELIKKYLIHIGKPENFKLTEDKVEHFKELQKIVRAYGSPKDGGVNLSPDERIAIRNAVFCLINQGTPHMQLRKIEKMIKRQLNDALDSITSLVEDCESVGNVSISEDDLEDDLEDEEFNPIKVKFTNATDILDADINKNQISELLRKAVVNLDAIDYQSPDLGKEPVKELIQRILDHAKNLEKSGE